jgi:hypothetical protein
MIRDYYSFIEEKGLKILSRASEIKPTHGLLM